MKDPWEIGVDGWPKSPDHPSNRDRRTVEELREAFFQRELRKLNRAHRDGHGSALVRAVDWCDRYQRPLPAWAVEGVRAALGEVASRGRPGARGKLARPVDADRENRKHYERWAWVRDLRDRDLPNPLGRVPSLEEAYSMAAEALEGTRAAGSEEVVRKSYQLVERLCRVGKGGRFYQP